VARSIDQRGDAVREGKLPNVLGAGPLDLRAIGSSEDDFHLDLTGQLRRLLVLCNDEGKTWAQQMAEGWIVDAVEGDPRAIVDIFDRIEKRRTAEVSAAADLPPIDDETAVKILEIISGSGEVATSASGDRAGANPPAEDAAGAGGTVEGLQRHQGP
jgi:hypothetical protein